MKRFPARYVMAILTALGMALIYGLRVNINITMVAMVNSSAVSGSASYTTITKPINGTFRGACGRLNQSEDALQEPGEYAWSNNLQGLILSSYYWGYIVVMFPGARISEMTSVKWMWFSGVAVNLVSCVLIPFGSDIHYSCTILLRMLQGFAAGVVFPATSLLLATWVPSSEKNTLASIVFAGTILGTVVSIIVTGIIEIHLGWRAVFYIMGTCTSPWLILWYFFVHDTPETARFISLHEIEYILRSHGKKAGEKTTIKIHWANICKSKPFWGLLLAHTCCSWNFYLLLIDLPIYLKKVFAFSMRSITLYMSVGYFSNWGFSMMLGAFLDLLRKKHIINQTTAKKTATFLSSVPIACCMVALCYIGCNSTAGVALIILSLMFFGGMWPGFMSNHVDIGPKIAATLMGLTNTTATLMGVIVPIFVGQVLGDGTDIRSWQIIFWVGVGFFVMGVVPYMFWGSGEVQDYYTEEDVPPSDETVNT